MPLQLPSPALSARPETPRVLSGLRVRPARLADLPAAARLVQRVVHECVSHWLEPEAIAEYSEFTLPDALASRFEGGHSFWLASVDDHLAGSMEVKGAGHILMLFIAPEFQRRGIARALLAKAFPGFPSRCAHALTVNSVPQSVPAYQHLGFHIYGEERNVRGIRFVPMKLNPSGAQ